MSTNEKKYKIALRYFFYSLNFIVQEISPDKVEYLFLFLRALFIIPLGNNNIKIRYLLPFLREAKYANK